MDPLDPNQTGSFAWDCVKRAVEQNQGNRQSLRSFLRSFDEHHVGFDPANVAFVNAELDPYAEIAISRSELADTRHRLASTQNELAHARDCCTCARAHDSEAEVEDEDAPMPVPPRQHSIEREDFNPRPPKRAGITAHIHGSTQRSIENNVSDSSEAFEPVPPTPLRIPAGATLRDRKVPGCGAMFYDEDTDEVVLLACCSCGANCGRTDTYLGEVAGLLGHIRRKHGKKFVPGKGNCASPARPSWQRA